MSKHETLTAGYRWPLTMTAPNEAVMGALLGMAKLWGCTDIGYDAIPPRKAPKPKEEKNPAHVKAGKKGGRPKNAKKDRKPQREVAQLFLEPLAIGDTFKMSEFKARMIKEGWPSVNNWHGAVNQLMQDKVVAREGMGVYRKLANMIVAKEAA